MAYSIYRFRSIDYALDIIKNGGIPLSRPEQFNDPFDASNIFIDKFVENNQEEINDNEHAFIYVDRITGDRKPIFDGLCEDLKNKREKWQTQIICFNKNVRNPLMWAHYGNYQQVALEFDLREFNNEIQNMFFDVEYRQYYPKQSKFRLGKIKEREQLKDIVDKLMHKHLLQTKNISWAYEEEIRFISALGRIDDNTFKLLIKSFSDHKNRETKAIILPTKALLAIHFGLRVHAHKTNLSCKDIEGKTFEEIQELCKRKSISNVLNGFIKDAQEAYPHIIFKMSFPHATRIEVDFIDLNGKNDYKVIKEMKDREERGEFTAFQFKEGEKNMPIEERRGRTAEEIKEMSIFDRLKHISIHYGLSEANDWQ